MASTNYLTVKTHVSEFKNSSDKDTTSEVSFLEFTPKSLEFRKDFKG